MTGGLRYALVAVAVLLVVTLSGWLGHRLAAGECADRELEVARAYASNQDAAVAAFRGESEAAEARVAELRTSRARALSRAEGLERDLAKLPRRPDGDFTDGELRALGNFHSELFGGDPGGVPDVLRTSTGTEQPALGLRASDDALGGSLQGPSR